MFTRILSAAALGALLIGITTQPTKAAGNWANSNHVDFLTFSAPVALPGVVLPAGTYTFEVPTAMVSTGLVRISSRDGRKIYLTQYTRVVSRPYGAEKVNVTFGEAKAGLARPINIWFPIGDTEGRQFIYN